MKILVIEDDKNIIETISLSFKVGWPGVDIVSTLEGQKGIALAETETPEVIILDLVLPDADGYEVLQKIRSFSNVPIIILSALEEETAIIKGLELGADDYITKPFRKMELLARIKTALRRQSMTSEQASVTCGPLKYIPLTRQVFLKNRDVKLTITEAEILAVLMKRAGFAVAHSELAEEVWGEDYANSADTIKVHIRHLREKLEADPSHPEMIITRPGVGYTLMVPE